ncbi:MAG TPA: sigma-70 family RNA polymerase sigma factor [Candidatus Dormibacteraeota bacterium]|nr:sigma-70 family RNA polymerase sigma factor [Candidatus Dormibacteraeota bacterium]
MKGEVGVTGQQRTVGCGLTALQSAGHRGIRWGSHGRQAGTASEPGHTLAAVPEQDGGALDIAQLVRRAAEGDRWAWERLVDQYARLIWAMTRDFKLVESDAADVFQATWLRLLEHIDRLEHPARVGSWLAATARHECLRSVAARKKVMLVHDDVTLKDGVAHEPEIDERLLSEERAQAVRDALSRLPWRWRRLVEMLMADPPVPYTVISDQLGLPVGSIGPTRGRCLERLRVLLQAS